MANDSSTAHSPPTGALSILERTTHFPTVLLVLAFLLALDSGVSLRYQTTVPSLSWGFAQEHVTLGDALVFFVVFGLYMSIVVVIARYIADTAARYSVMPLWYKLFYQNHDEKPPYRGAVRYWKLREAAHTEQNKFYLDIYKEHEALLHKDRGNEWRMASTAFACLLLGGINYVLLPKFGYPSFSQRMASGFPDIWNWVSAISSLLLITIWLLPQLRNDYADGWVYCLSLDRKLRDEKIKAREQGILP